MNLPHISTDHYFFDNSSKEWALFALFLMIQGGELESTINHVEWLDRHYDSVDQSFERNPRIHLSRSPSEEFREMWDRFKKSRENWTRDEIKIAAEVIGHAWQFWIKTKKAKRAA